MEPRRRAGVGPRIQYCKTSDGVNIAYAVFGEGLPLVYLTTFPGQPPPLLPFRAVQAFHGPARGGGPAGDPL